ncbi:MAG: RNase H family protein [Caldilineaceae bacterium]
MTTGVTLPEVTLYTFACCPDEPGPGGYGTRLIYGTYHKEFAVTYRQTTVERLAIMAIIAGLGAMKARCRITLYANLASVAAIVRSERLQHWQQNGWQQGRRAVSNADLWQELWHLCTLHEIHCAETLLRDDLSVLLALSDLVDVELQIDNWAIDGPYEADSNFSVPITAGEVPSSSENEMTTNLRLARPVQPPTDQEVWRNGDTVYLRHDGQYYLWDGYEWCDSRYITPPLSLLATRTSVWLII